MYEVWSMGYKPLEELTNIEVKPSSLSIYIYSYIPKCLVFSSFKGNRES